MEAQRFIPNDQPLQALPRKPEELLQVALDELLRSHPPKDSYPDNPHVGVFGDYSGLICLLLELHGLRPDLRFEGHDMLYWAKEHAKAPRHYKNVSLRSGCGLTSDKLCYEAVRACVTKDRADVDTFLAILPEILNPKPLLEDEQPSPFISNGREYNAEMTYGRAAVLYFMRLVRKWVPDCAATVDEFIAKLVDSLMSSDNDGNLIWLWSGNEYTGPPHGDIGIITQIVLSRPDTAPKLSSKLGDLLDLQDPDGGWPGQKHEAKDPDAVRRVQFCHGAPGMAFALRRVRPFFPELHSRIDVAVEKAQEMTWKRGLLTKEPNLCHGILGNAFAFGPGERRSHFLAFGTPDAIRKMRETDSSMFEPAAYDMEIAVNFQYLPSAVWTWAVCEMELPPMLLFDDA